MGQRPEKAFCAHARAKADGGSAMGRPIEPATAAAESQDNEGDGGGRGDLLRRSFDNVTVSDRGL
jgi:hypothetical protein